MLAVAIIGAGFGGIGMGIRLRQRGIDDFLIFERAATSGGVWRDNTYPGCACDVDSDLYSFSFAPKSDWSHRFARGPEIQAYLQACCERFELSSQLRFGHELISARWDAEQDCWHLETNQGLFRARVLVTATGAFSEPKLPALPGLESFQGDSFHSSRWDAGCELAGRRVGVIGTGASAIQFVPEIQPQVGHLSLFQRTPAWIVPRPDAPVSPRRQALYSSLPLLQRLRRLSIYLVRELIGLSFRHPRLMGMNRQYALWHLKRSVRDPELRQQLTPDYAMGCKRVLLSSVFYPALTQDNVSVVSSPITALTATGARTADGREHPLDVLIFGTGFEVSEFRLAERIRGRTGECLSELWQGSPSAHLGTMVAGFPNLFLLLGPNTGLGHSSVVLMIETQIEFVLQALDALAGRGQALEPKPEAQGGFMTELDKQSGRTVWSSGCRSWYLDAQGRNAALWPASIGSFRRRLLPLRLQEYNFEKTDTHST